GVWVRDWAGGYGTWVNEVRILTGTWLNDVRIIADGAVPLRPCDWLKLGGAVLQLVFLGPVEPGWLAWQGGTVGKLSLGVLERGWAGQGPVLHDALVEAGCEDPDLLGHCREGCPHGKNCSLLPVLLPGPGRLPVERAGPSPLLQ